MREKKLIASGSLTILIALMVGIFLITPAHHPNTCAEIIALPVARLADLDIALMNLLCAEGLPGSENLDIPKALKTFDQWAQDVKLNEEKYSGQYHQNPGRYDKSYAMFQAVNLGLTLKDDLKCGYNHELIKSGAMADVRSTRFFRNSSDLFLHGYAEDRKGSCSSLPVLMVAVGRRCGYPLYLVTCKGHLFCRWDDGEEIFNIETACAGVDSKPDEYYKNWPYPCTEQEIKDEKYLKNLTSFEELGVFCQIRAACLQEHGRYQEAQDAYSQALKAFPNSKHILQYAQKCGSL